MPVGGGWEEKGEERGEEEGREEKGEKKKGRSWFWGGGKKEGVNRVPFIERDVLYGEGERNE